MNIIRDHRTTVQPTTGFGVEVHTIDAHAGQSIDDLIDHLIANPDLLLNPTLTASDIRTSQNLDDGWRVFRGLVGTGQFTSGSGKRLVLKAVDQ